MLATSSSEVAIPRLMGKLEQLGCRQSVVGLVVPAGYSLNTDGSAIYLSMGLLFIAQAMNLQLSWTEMFSIFAVMLVMSKGVAGVGLVRHSSVTRARYNWQPCKSFLLQEWRCCSTSNASCRWREQ